MIILGIESSCDDTSAAIIKDCVLLSNVIASQRVHEPMAEWCQSSPRVPTSRTLCQW